MPRTEAGPLIAQSDHSLLLEVDHPQYEACRDFLAAFAELVKSPEYVHTYRVTPLSVWNAAAVGLPLPEIIHGLGRFSKYSVPELVSESIAEWYRRYGKLVLRPHSAAHHLLGVEDPGVRERVLQDARLRQFVAAEVEGGVLVAAEKRGLLKQAFIEAGLPIRDLCGYEQGEALPVRLRDIDRDGKAFSLHDYQREAVEVFYQSGRAAGGSGVVVLPCGSGKTIIGLGAIVRVGCHTLIIATNQTAVLQWRSELLAKTTLPADQIGIYTGAGKEIKPVTITTYQMLTYRRSQDAPMNNLNLFTAHGWGLIVYDEVHVLPAPVFQATAGIQAKRRLGLTATLIREDGREGDVFALIGPKRYDVPWKTLERRGYVAEAGCTEYRLPLPRSRETAYAMADRRARYRIAAENPNKLELVRELISNHAGESILIIGQYLAQLQGIAKEFDLPLITGQIRQSERERLFAAFKTGALKTLVLSKVANFAVDLPDANVLIQVSGAFGSRQEEAQRLGRILRPKRRSSHFYTLVSKDTDEQSFSHNRQLFLVEQGYRYRVEYGRGMNM